MLATRARADDEQQERDGFLSARPRRDRRVGSTSGRAYRTVTVSWNTRWNIAYGPNMTAQEGGPSPTVAREHGPSVRRREQEQEQTGGRQREDDSGQKRQSPTAARMCSGARARQLSASGSSTASRRRRSPRPPDCRAQSGSRRARRSQRRAESPRLRRRPRLPPASRSRDRASGSRARHEQNGRSSGAVRTTVCDRKPIARPARNAPASSARGAGSRADDRASRQRPGDQDQSRDRDAQPGHVAQRPQRGEPEQRRGRPPSRRRARAPRMRGRARATRRRRSSRSAGAGERAPHRQAAHFRRRDTRRAQQRRGELAERDEQRISGRMRLVLRDVEVADAQREVDGVDVVERGRAARRGARARNSAASAGRRSRAVSGTQTGRRRSASLRLPRR